MESPIYKYVYKSYLFQGFLGAIVINLFLFCSLPALVSIKTSQNDLESLNVVNFVRIKPEPIKPKQKEKPKEDEKKPEKILRVNRQQHKQVTKRELKLNMPAMDLDIDQRITGGVPVISPAMDFNTIMDQEEVDTIPMPTFKTPPRYPYRAKRMGLEGVVKIRFLVDREGQVSDITILKANPPDIFNESVIHAISSWKYAPGELMGRKVATMVTTSIVFKLEGQQ